MNDSRGKSKPTLDSLLKDQQVITGKDLIKQAKDAEKQKALLQEAIEFEQRIENPCVGGSIPPRATKKHRYVPDTCFTSGTDHMVYTSSKPSSYFHSTA